MVLLLNLVCISLGIEYIVHDLLGYAVSVVNNLDLFYNLAVLYRCYILHSPGNLTSLL